MVKAAAALLPSLLGALVYPVNRRCGVGVADPGCAQEGQRREHTQGDPPGGNLRERRGAASAVYRGHQEVFSAAYG